MIVPDDGDVVNERGGPDASVDLDEEKIEPGLSEEALRDHGAHDIVHDQGRGIEAPFKGVFRSWLVHPNTVD